MFKTVLVIQLALLILVGGSWIGNLVKLTDCDFEANYRCEVVHGIGVIPPAAVVTVWFDSDKEQP